MTSALDNRLADLDHALDNPVDGPAMQQLEIALKKVDKSDFQETSKLESRLAKLKEAVEKEEKEDKL